MTSVLISLLSMFRGGVRSRAALHVEILALRHQLEPDPRLDRCAEIQLQNDVGDKRVRIAGASVRVFLLVAVPGRLARGIAAALAHVGGVPRILLGDNAGALVIGRVRATGTVVFHSGYLAYCRDWDVQPRACALYRARTTEKTDAGVK